MAPEEFVTEVAGADAEQSFQKFKPRALALKESELIVVNVDMPNALLTAIAAIPKIAPYFEVVRSLPVYDFQHFLDFRELTLALHAAQAKHTHAKGPTNDLPARLVDATKRRDLLLADCAALIARGILSKESTANYKGLTGYKNVAFDLTGLIELVSETWPQIEGKTFLTKQDLDEHRAFALSFVQAVAYKDQFKVKIAEMGDIRQRFYTLFYHSYDQVRRAMLFLRWNEEDADAIIPSLFAGRGGNPSKAAETDDTAGDGTAPEASPATATVPTAQTVDPAAAKVPAGHPASAPFSAA